MNIYKLASTIAQVFLGISVLAVLAGIAALAFGDGTYVLLGGLASVLPAIGLAVAAEIGEDLRAIRHRATPAPQA